MERVSKAVSCLFFITSVHTGNTFADNSYYHYFTKPQGYEITITNLTANNPLSPPVIGTHAKGLKVFTVNEPASPGLTEITTFGLSVDTLMNEWQDSGKLLDMDIAVPTVNAPPSPLDGGPGSVVKQGTSSSITLKINDHHEHVSLVSMIAPTNDAFVSVNGELGPQRIGQTRTFYLNAYDAGVEANSEICHIDQPIVPSDPSTYPKDPLTMPPAKSQCIGSADGSSILPVPGLRPVPDGIGARDMTVPEGYVHVHRGIQGIGDLHPAIYRWNNPVAKVTIKRVLLD